jgi:hypothetical protein
MNGIYRVNLSGGIIGWLMTSPKRALAKCFDEVGENQEEVVFVLGDQMNLVQTIVYTVVLLLTLLLWCPSPGYLVVSKPVGQ